MNNKLLLFIFVSLVCLGTVSAYNYTDLYPTMNQIINNAIVNFNVTLNSTFAYKDSTLYINDILYKSHTNFDICYQQYNDVATECGGNSNGTYWNSGDGYCDPVVYHNSFSDNDISTSYNCYYQIWHLNWSVPYTAKNNSIVTYRFSGLASWENHSIENCSISDGVLRFKVFQGYIGGYTNLSCWNSTHYTTLYYNAAGTGKSYVYEIGSMYWNLSKDSYKLLLNESINNFTIQISNSTHTFNTTTNNFTVDYSRNSTLVTNTKAQTFVRFEMNLTDNDLTSQCKLILNGTEKVLSSIDYGNNTLYYYDFLSSTDAGFYGNLTINWTYNLTNGSDYSFGSTFLNGINLTLFNYNVNITFNGSINGTISDMDTVETFNTNQSFNDFDYTSDTLVSFNNLTGEYVQTFDLSGITGEEVFLPTILGTDLVQVNIKTINNQYSPLSVSNIYIYEVRVPYNDVYKLVSILQTNDYGFSKFYIDRNANFKIVINHPNYDYYEKIYPAQGTNLSQYEPIYVILTKGVTTPTTAQITPIGSYYGTEPEINILFRADADYLTNLTCKSDYDGVTRLMIPSGFANTLQCRFSPGQGYNVAGNCTTSFFYYIYKNGLQIHSQNVSCESSQSVMPIPSYSQETPEKWKYFQVLGFIAVLLIAVGVSIFIPSVPLSGFHTFNIGIVVIGILTQSFLIPILIISIYYLGSYIRKVIGVEQ